MGETPHRLNVSYFTMIIVMIVDYTYTYASCLQGQHMAAILGQNAIRSSNGTPVTCGTVVTVVLESHCQCGVCFLPPQWHPRLHCTLGFAVSFLASPWGHIPPRAHHSGGKKHYLH